MKPTIKPFLKAASVAVDLLLSAILWMLMLAFGGAACVVAGVHLLAGPAWAFLAAGALLLLAASFIGRGLNG